MAYGDVFTFAGTRSVRLATTASSAGAGASWYETDTNQTYVSDGSTWQERREPIISGLDGVLDYQFPAGTLPNSAAISIGSAPTGGRAEGILAGGTFGDSGLSERNIIHISPTWAPTNDLSAGFVGFDSSFTTFSDANATGAMTGFYAVFDMVADCNNATQTVTRLIGQRAALNKKGAGTLTNLECFRAQPTGLNTGVATNVYGFLFNGASVNNTVTFTNSYGVRVDDITGAGTVTNQYGVYISAQTKGASLKYGLYVEANTVHFDDVVNLELGTGTGTKIGTGTTQKLGFYNATPVSQPNTTGTATGFTAGAGTGVKDDSTFTGAVGSTAYRISDIVKHLKNLGLIAQ